MESTLHGVRALVCGASQGIGRACALALARRGAGVVGLARSREKLAALHTTLREMAPGASHGVVEADLCDPQGASAAVGRCIEAEGPIHILIANTGGPPAGTVVDATGAQLLAAFTAQLLSAHALLGVLLPGMKQARFGRIITITSTSVKQPIPGLGISNVVRPSVAAWAKCLATELGPHGITANNVLPGYTDTERLGEIVAGRAAKAGVDASAVREELASGTPARRFGTPEEIAAAVAFLASREAGYINGINLPVDGGRLGTL